ncbi:hypothetical protein KQI30_15420 [Clostridium bornimense]|nr:hypothetical protein [Clostridium bornimense]MBU5317640.1 hypothetical protein [Clostridium bornimense]
METSLFSTIMACINIILVIGIIALIGFVLFFMIRTFRIYKKNKMKK